MVLKTPVITTKRTHLRALTISDKAAIYSLRSNPEIGTYLRRPLAKTEKEAADFIEKINKGFIENEWIYWGITLINSSKIIGTICLWNFSEKENSGEIGYELLPNFQKKGLMQEAISAILKFSFNELKLNKITAQVNPNNQASIRSLLRNNFIQKESTKKYFYLPSYKYFQYHK